mmetsp:Transcript_20808/g.26931  ORF Transcript_20808/g.26931 Transcript_20808/m.26931 type:complete len:177 (-) Transcript_20808:962-1492(-)
MGYYKSYKELFFLFFILTQRLISGKQCEGKNLPVSDPLRIGSKKKIAEEECTQRAKVGDRISVHYDGILYSDCSKFDSSRDREEPFSFTLGKNEVIKGWDDGLRGMCVGDIRKLTIPSDLAYGDQGSGDKIPPGSTLVFEIELIDVKKAASPRKKQQKRKKKTKKKKTVQNEDALL